MNRFSVPAYRSRARFAPSTSSLLVVCPLRWLLEPVGPEDETPRWRLIRLLKHAPTEPLVLPVRDVRVLYGLKTRHYLGFAKSQMPQPHENGAVTRSPTLQPRTPAPTAATTPANSWPGT